MLGLLLSIGGVVVAVCAVTLGTTSTLLGLGVAALVVLAVYAVRHPSVLLGTLIVVEVTNLSGVTGIPLISALVALGLLAVGISLRDPAKRERLDRWAAVGIILVGCYLGTKALAVLWSQDVAVSANHLLGGSISTSG